MASEKLIERLVRWLVDDKHLRASAAGTLKEELLTLKYLGSRSPFLCQMARDHAKKLAGGTVPFPVEKKPAGKKKISVGGRTAARTPANR